VDLVLSLLDTFFSCRVSHCRRASIRTLEERIGSLGACWAFLFQPVLLSVWRPLVSLKSGTWPRRLTQSPELGFGFCLSSLGTISILVLRLLFTRLPQPSLGCCCAKARILLHSPTNDAATPPAFLPWQRSLASYRFFHRAPPVSVPSVWRSQSIPNGPKICCAPCTSSVRR
jgi:hypothetical protein